MGDIKSVSLSPKFTCELLPCWKKCYARRMENRRSSVRNAYANNYNILINDKEQYWREVEAAIMTSRFFRFHVAGDIPDIDYLRRMDAVADRNKHCEILCFTKKYSIVNEYLSNIHAVGLSPNLQIIFSRWPGLECDNPFNLPEAHVRFRNGTTTATAESKPCSGNCTECAVTNGGCWNLKHGESVVFEEH